MSFPFLNLIVMHFTVSSCFRYSFISPKVYVSKMSDYLTLHCWPWGGAECTPHILQHRCSRLAANSTGGQKIRILYITQCGGVSGGSYYIYLTDIRGNLLMMSYDVII